MNRLCGLLPHRWMIVAVLLASAVGATTPFTLRFGASGSMTIAMDPADDPEDLKSYQLGFRVGALSGFDGFDIPRPSVTPPGGGVAILYFPADAPIYGLSQDFRPPAASDSWQMELVGMSVGSSVTLQWRLQDGSLAGNALSLVDRSSGAVLVGNMATTTSYVFTDTNRSLLVLYSSANHPPTARGDVAAMLESGISLQIPFDALLANDYDADTGDTIEVVAVGAPFILPGSGKGTNAYGTTSIDTDPGVRMITYTLPVPLPADWDGTVYFAYTIRDSNLDPIAPHEGSATVEVTVAPHVLTVPLPALVPAHTGQPFAVSYALTYAGSLQSLAISFTLPTTGAGPTIAFWPYGGSYSDDDAGTPDPTVDSGVGPDGIWGTNDDTGVVLLNFGTNVPLSGTIFSFMVNAPASATDAALPSMASYKVTGAEPVFLEQPLPDVAVRMAYTVSFAADGNGTIEGAASQLLEPGRPSTQVTAVPSSGYHFLRWTRGGVEISRDNPLTLVGGSADQTVTAEFAPNIYTITFLTSGAGTLTGATTQNVPYLGSTTAVTAVPGADSYFSQWTDGSTDNPRTLTGVAASATYTAEFLPLSPGAPDGHFELVYQNQNTGVLRHLWDLTGHYETNAGAYGLTLDIIQHEDGALTGVGQLQGSVGGQAFTVANMPLSGRCTGKNGSLLVRGGLAGANATTAVSLRLSLTRNGLTLSGALTGRVAHTVGGRQSINELCTLDLPAGMDGTYRLPTDLTLGARGTINGTSTLVLANGRTVALRVRGRGHGSLATLEFKGDKTVDPAFGAVSFRLTVRTFTNQMAGIRVQSGRAFGQILSWHL